MEKEDIIDLLKLKKFRKLTGPPEHWLTTYNTNFWGLEQKHEKIWEAKINVGDLFIFHSTDIMYLSKKTKLNTGIIGLGILGAKSKKTTLEWVNELKTETNQWPLLLHFSEIWWFGNLNEIDNITVAERLKRPENIITNDLVNLTHNVITFEEMRRYNCVIPAQGSIQNIADEKREILVELITSHLDNDSIVPDLSSFEILISENTEKLPLTNDDDVLKNFVRRISNLRNINQNENEEEATKRERKLITYEQNNQAQEKANKKHRKTLILLAEYIRKSELIPQESVIDLFVENKDEIFIFEVKSIHRDNFKHQTREAIGQLLEYEYFEVKKINTNKKVYRSIIYSEEPPINMINFLKAYNFNVYWITNDVVSGDNKSKEILDIFLKNIKS